MTTLNKHVYLTIFEYLPAIKYPKLRLICRNANAAINAICLAKIVAKGPTQTYMESIICNKCVEVKLFNQLVHYKLCNVPICSTCEHLSHYKCQCQNIICKRCRYKSSNIYSCA